MRRNRLGKERFARGAATTSSPGLFPFKMAGHVSGANIPGNVVFATRCFFPPIPFSKGKAQQTRLELRSLAENGMLLTAGEATRIGALQPKL